jgi:nanoRNase/pAp phosphatase (c-di-AMP/oligoRNAs hydrolase)
MGGGGHDYAAGFAISATMEKTVDAVIKRLDSLVQSFEKFGK